MVLQLGVVNESVRDGEDQEDVSLLWKINSTGAKG